MPLASEILPMLHEPAEYTFSSRTRAKATQAESGKILTRDYGGQWYELTLAWPPMVKEEFGPITAFLESQGGKNGIFFVQIPPMTDQAGFVIGNLVNFDNDTKLHRITALAPTALYPLARNVGGVLVTDPVYLRCSLKNNVHQTQHRRDGFTTFEIDLVERL